MTQSVGFPQKVPISNQNKGQLFAEFLQKVPIQSMGRLHIYLALVDFYGNPMGYC